MKKRRLLTFLALLLALSLWIIWNNKALETSEYTISDPNIPSAFDGLRIAQVSDLHNASFGDENAKLLSALRASEPDLIFLTGDLLDSRDTDAALALAFVTEAVSIAPVYYCLGNHESRIPEIYEPFEQELLDLGVTVLRNEVVTLEKEGQHLYIAGIDDPDFFASTENFHRVLEELCRDEGYTLLLSHRPELFESYVEYGAELVFSGHAHGGQFRLPFIGGLFAPHQGLFPKYDAGHFSEGACHMLVSRGLGNSGFPFRILNRPELVVVALQAGETE